MQTKIYIKGLNPVDVININKLESYLRLEENIVEIFSPEGIFNIENGKMYKLKPIDAQIIETPFDKFVLMLDTSYYEKEQILSQIPYEHISNLVTRFYYGTTNNNIHVNKNKIFLQFIVEGIHELNKFVPTSFYFLLNESFDNILVKKEIGVFLSMLN